MPAKAPPRGKYVEEKLAQFGRQIRERRKTLKVTAKATAEAAGISRLTLSRIEKGMASVTIGSYFNVISVLDLDCFFRGHEKESQRSNLTRATTIQLSDYPQLSKLAWQLKQKKSLLPKEALTLYERHWRHVDTNQLTTQEKDLIKELLSLYGKERLLV